MLKWPLLWGMIRHVIPHYMWDLIDKICGDLFPRTVEFSQQIFKQRREGGEYKWAWAFELLLVFIYIRKHKLQKDHKTSSVEGWKNKAQKYWTLVKLYISILWEFIFLLYFLSIYNMFDFMEAASKKNQPNFHYQLIYPLFSSLTISLWNCEKYLSQFPTVQNKVFCLTNSLKAKDIYLIVIV